MFLSASPPCRFPALSPVRPPDRPPARTPESPPACLTARPPARPSPAPAPDSPRVRQPLGPAARPPVRPRARPPSRSPVRCSAALAPALPPSPASSPSSAAFRPARPRPFSPGCARSRPIPPARALARPVARPLVRAPVRPPARPSPSPPPPCSGSRPACQPRPKFVRRQCVGPVVVFSCACRPSRIRKIAQSQGASFVHHASFCPCRTTCRWPKASAAPCPRALVFSCDSAGPVASGKIALSQAASFVHHASFCPRRNHAGDRQHQERAARADQHDADHGVAALSRDRGIQPNCSSPTRLLYTDPIHDPAALASLCWLAPRRTKRGGDSDPSEHRTL